MRTRSTMRFWPCYGSRCINERCAWKGFDWATTDRLHKKGLIGDPVNKSKSLILTDEGPGAFAIIVPGAVYAAAAIAVP